jgi:DNA primase
VRLVQPRYATVPASHGGRVLILTDGDDAGRRCAVSIFDAVAPSRCVRWVRLAEGQQPTDLNN